MQYGQAGGGPKDKKSSECHMPMATYQKKRTLAELGIRKNVEQGQDDISLNPVQTCETCTISLTSGVSPTKSTLLTGTWHRPRAHIQECVQLNSRVLPLPSPEGSGGGQPPSALSKTSRTSLKWTDDLRLRTRQLHSWVLERAHARARPGCVSLHPKT